MKYTIASLFAVIGATQKVPIAEECDMMCAMIYSFDPVTCSCVPIEWMECHP